MDTIGAAFSRYTITSLGIVAEQLQFLLRRICRRAGVLLPVRHTVPAAGSTTPARLRRRCVHPSPPTDQRPGSAKGIASLGLARVGDGEELGLADCAASDPSRQQAMAGRVCGPPRRPGSSVQADPHDRYSPVAASFPARQLARPRQGHRNRSSAVATCPCSSTRQQDRPLLDTSCVGRVKDNLSPIGNLARNSPKGRFADSANCVTLATCRAAGECGMAKSDRIHGCGRLWGGAG